MSRRSARFPADWVSLIHRTRECIAVASAASDGAVQWTRWMMALAVFSACGSDDGGDDAAATDTEAASSDSGDGGDAPADGTTDAATGATTGVGSDDDSGPLDGETGTEETGPAGTCAAGDEGCRCEPVDTVLAKGVHAVWAADTSPPIVVWRDTSSLYAQTLSQPDALGGAAVPLETFAASVSLTSNAAGDVMLSLPKTSSVEFLALSASLVPEPLVVGFDEARSVALHPDGDGWAAFSFALDTQEETRTFYRSSLDAQGAVLEDGMIFSLPHDGFVPERLAIAAAGDDWALAFGTDLDGVDPFYDLRVGIYDGAGAPVVDPVVVAGGQRPPFALVVDDAGLDLVYGGSSGGVARYEPASLTEVAAATVGEGTVLDAVRTSAGWTFLFLDFFGDANVTVQSVDDTLGNVGVAVELGDADPLKLAVVDDEVVVLSRGTEAAGLPLISTQLLCTPT